MVWVLMLGRFPCLWEKGAMMLVKLFCQDPWFGLGVPLL